MKSTTQVPPGREAQSEDHMFPGRLPWDFRVYLGLIVYPSMKQADGELSKQSEAWMPRTPRVRFAVSGVVSAT